MEDILMSHIESVGLKNVAKTDINPATEDKQDTANTKLDALNNSVQNIIGGYSGSGTDTTLTLTNANTAYAVPTTPPASAYTLVIINVSNTDIYIREQTGIMAGAKIVPNQLYSIPYIGGVGAFVYCGSAGKTINVKTIIK